MDYELVRAPAFDDNPYAPDEESEDAVEVPHTVSGTTGRASDRITEDGIYFYVLNLRIGPERGYGYTPGGETWWRVDTTQNPAVVE